MSPSVLQEFRWNKIAMVFQGAIYPVDELCNNHLEGDTQVWLHALNSTGKNVLIYSIDTDIYGQDAWFPQSPVILHERIQMRDLTLVTVEVAESL